MIPSFFLMYLIALITTYIIIADTQLLVDTSNLRQIACSVDDDCLTYSNAKCYNNVCSLCDDSSQCTLVGRWLSSQCTTNNDCTDPTASYCDLTSQTCQACSYSSDCSHLTPTPYCFGGVCDTKECNTNTDCTDITKSFCDSSTGTNLCQVCNNDDTQCTRFPDTQYCNSTLGCVQCTSTNPCSDSTLLCFNGECVQCGTNDDCTDISASYCDSSGTNLCQVCNDNTQCTRFSDTQYCNSTLGGCVQCTSTDPCSDSTLVCLDGGCVECATNDDCTDISKSVCDTTANTCQACSSNPDCAHLTTTPYCWNSVCSSDECLTDTDCMDIAKSFCDSSTGTNLCQACSNDDTKCARFPDTQYCSPTATGCVACGSNNNCPLVTSSFCNPAGSYVCQPCADNSQCTNFPLTPSCKANVQCVECISNDNCTDITKSFCNTGNTCSMCSTSNDCTHLTSTPYCAGSPTGCVQCLALANCTNALTSFCNNMVCTTCTAQSHCTHITNKKICSFDPSLGCVQCMTDTDCTTAAKSYCDTTTHTCTACNHDAQCTRLTATPYCSLTTTGCVQCMNSTTCTSITSSYCNTGTHLCKPCISDTYCTSFSLTPVCQTNTKCVQCLNSTLHCLNQLLAYCNPTSYTCQLCTSNADCAHFAVEKVCSVQPSLGCVQCMASTDCTDPTKSYCNLTTHTCQLCANDAQCAHLSATPYCSIATATCTECLQTAHCLTLPKSYCNLSTLACQTCANDSQCSHLFATPYCSLTASRCAECLISDVCTNTLTSYCNSTTLACQACADDSQCSHFTTTPLCYDSTVGCVNCTSNSGCPSRFSSYCNPTPHACQSCTADSQCTHITSMNKCWYGECVIYAPVCSPTYVITVVQLTTMNDFIVDVPAALAALIDIPSKIYITFADASTSDFVYSITANSPTEFDIYVDPIKSIPASQITVQIPCPRTTLNVYGNITATATNKRIMYASKELKAGLNTMGDAGDSATTAMSGISSAMVFIGANPAILWAMLSLVQTFYYMLFINVEYPANVQAFFPIFQIAELNFIPNPSWIIFPNIDQVTLPVPSKFEENNVNGLFLENAGNMLLLWIGNMVFYGFSFLVMRYTRNRPQVLTFVCSKLVNMFEWSGTFRIFISSYMELTLAAFLQIRVLTYSTGLLASSSVCGILFTGFGIFFPILAFFIVKKYEVRPKYILRKFGTLIDEYDLKHPFSKYFTVMYIVRNLVIAFALVYLHDYNYIQIALLTSINFGFAFMLWKYKPYENKVSNIFNFISELMFAFVHIIIFVLIHDDHTEFLNDPQRIKVGWGIMVGCAIILVASIMVAFAQQYVMIKKTINLIRKLLQKGKGRKQAQNKITADPQRQSQHIDHLRPLEHSICDSADLSSTNLMSSSSPVLGPKEENLEVTSNMGDFKLAGLQRLARLNFDSQHNRVRLGIPLKIIQKRKKAKCAN